jgi:hypothetical protein
MNPVYQVPPQQGDRPIYPDGPLSPDQHWNRLEQNLLGPVPPASAPLNGQMPHQPPSSPYNGSQAPSMPFQQRQPPIIGMRG